MSRGRPAVTRDRAFHWLDKHYPCSQGQFIRALDLERSYARRIWRQWEAAKSVFGDFCPVPELQKAA
jgi:hypothetical protein